MEKMKDLRPMPILLIKNRFLKILYDLTLKREFLDYHQILLARFPKFFDIEPVTNEEIEKGRIGIFELERDGYIEKKTNFKNKYKLTMKGVNVAKKKIEDMRLPLVDLTDILISRHDLLDKVYNDYKVGDFESTIFKAFKLLEEKVRTKTESPPSDRPQDLMSDAFKSNGGLLKYPYAKTSGEQDGIHFLMRGAIMFFKSPRSHRTVISDDPNSVMNILAFAKYLLDLIDKCELTNISR